MSVSATALQYVSDHMDIKSNDKWLIAGAKLAGGTISKTTVAAFAALEFIARSVMLILAGLPYCLSLISKKTFSDMTAKTTSAFKTIGGAIAALATIRAAEKKENSLLPSKAKLYGTMSWLKEKVSGISSKMNNPTPTPNGSYYIAVITAVAVGAIAFYYSYPTAAPQVEGNEMCHLYSMCDRISLNPDQSSVLPVSKWRLNQFLQRFINESSSLSPTEWKQQSDIGYELGERAKELSPYCSLEFQHRVLTVELKYIKRVAGSTFSWGETIGMNAMGIALKLSGFVLHNGFSNELLPSC